MYRIDEIEDAIVNAAIAAGYSARPFNRAPVETEIEKEAAEKPSTLVVFERAEPARLRTSSIKGTVFHFQLFVTARNLRGATSAVRGDASSIGIYSVLDGIRSALEGSSLGLTAQPINWVSQKAYTRTSRYSVYLQTWSLTVFE